MPHEGQGRSTAPVRVARAGDTGGRPQYARESTAVPARAGPTRDGPPDGCAGTHRAEPPRMDATRTKVFQYLQEIPKDTLLFIDYEPASPRRSAAGEAALEASRKAGLADTHYIGKFMYAEVRGDQPVFFVRVANRGNEPRCFAPFKGKLKAIRVLEQAARAA